MQFHRLAIPDLLLITPNTIEDDRGFFYESYNALEFESAVGKQTNFVQDNHSKSVKGALRGLHYQLPPHAQGKLVRVTKGEVFDVVVDIRKSSSTFGQWVGEVLSDVNKKQLWIPPGFAHGFLTLSEVSEFQYKTTSHYYSECERCILWNDPEIAVKWPLSYPPILSLKDQEGCALFQADLF